MSHALLFIADSLEESSVIPELFTKGTDIEHFIFDAFGIGEARELQRRAYLKPVIRPTRDFVVSFSSITSEAQNALLKLFEEPPENAIFHIVISREDVLIPTLRSRLLLVDVKNSDANTDNIKTFLKMSQGERMDEIAKRTKAKDIVWIESIAAGSEKYAVAQKGIRKEKSLKAVIFIRQFLGARGSSSKMLLEELALSLPHSK